MIHTPEEAGFEGKVKMQRQSIFFKHSWKVHPHEASKTGAWFREEFLWYHPQEGTKELYWVDKEGRMYKLLFIRSLPDEDWVDMINSENKKQAFIDMVFNYIDNGGDKEEVKRNIKEMLR